MIRLKNIRKKNNTIHCDIYPEASQTPGKIEYDCVKHEVLNYSLPEGYSWFLVGIHFAKRHLDEMDYDNLPEEELIMWY